MKIKNYLMTVLLCAALTISGCAGNVTSSSEAANQTSDTAPKVTATASPAENPTATPTNTPTPAAEPSATPKPTIIAQYEGNQSETSTAAPTVEPQTSADTLPLSGYVIGIDSGHQAQGNSEQEPVAPGSSETKAKVSSGTQGRYTGIPEYQVNMNVALLLRDLLQAKGATVVMTHETLDVNISNAERAVFFNENNTDYAIRIHCNGSDDTSVNGALIMVPTENPYLEECNRAASLLIDAYCNATGFKNMGVMSVNNQTGFNWCERMVVLVEMGFMTNYEDDVRLTDTTFQQTMAQGLCDGIEAYFAG